MATDEIGPGKLEALRGIRGRLEDESKDGYLLQAVDELIEHYATERNSERADARARSERREVALLRIVIAAGERALEAFQASDDPRDADFVADLERVVARSRVELRVLVEDLNR